MNRSLLLESLLAVTAGGMLAGAYLIIRGSVYTQSDTIPDVGTLSPTKMPVGPQQRHTWRKVMSRYTNKMTGIRVGATTWPHNLKRPARHNHESSSFA